MAPVFCYDAEPPQCDASELSVVDEAIYGDSWFLCEINIIIVPDAHRSRDEQERATSAPDTAGSDLRRPLEQYLVCTKCGAHGRLLKKHN